MPHAISRRRKYANPTLCMIAMRDGYHAGCAYHQSGSTSA
jgi:hypothetical protein